MIIFSEKILSKSSLQVFVVFFLCVAAFGLRIAPL